MKYTKQIIIGAVTTSILLSGCTSSTTTVTNTVKEKQVCAITQTPKTVDYKQNSETIDYTKTIIEKINKETKNSIKTFELGEKNHKEIIEKSIKEKCETILGIGSLSEEIMLYFAASTPEINFISVVEEFTTKLKNTKSVLINQLETGFLAGYLSAGMTRTGKIATFTDTDKDHLNTYINGIADGIAKYNADNGTAIELVGLDKNLEELKDSKPETLDKFVDTLLKEKADIFVPALEKNQEKVLEKIAKVENTNIILLGQNSDVIENTQNTQNSDKNENKDDKKDEENKDNKDDKKEEKTEKENSKETNNKKLDLANSLVEFESLLKDIIIKAQKGEFTNKTVRTTLKNKALSFVINKEIEKDIPETLRKNLKEIENKIIKGELMIYSPKQN